MSLLSYVESDSLENLKHEFDSDIMKEEWFLKDRDGKITPFLKEDILKGKINVFKPSTFLPLLKELDIPFLEDEYLYTLEHFIKREMSSVTVFRYIKKCNELLAFKHLRFKDSDIDFLNYDDYKNFTYNPIITIDFKKKKGVY